MARKKITLIVLVAIIAAVIFALLSFSFVNAAEVNLPDAQALQDLIPAPIKEFFDSISSIGAEQGAALNLDWQTPANIYDRADAWFMDTTGIGLRDAFRGIGNAIVWFLELVLSFFKWLLALAG
ncbi:MAG: hypothetical protein AAB897_00560 [Patescibacteria group bacterium]